MSWEQPARRATDGAGQVIEVLRQGDWWPAVLLGCRLEPDGRPLAHARLDADPPRLLWLSFTELRLPPAAPPDRCLLGPTAEAGRHRAPSPPARQPADAAGPPTLRLPLSRISVPPRSAGPRRAGVDTAPRWDAEAWADRVR